MTSLVGRVFLFGTDYILSLHFQSRLNCLEL